MFEVCVAFAFEVMVHFLSQHYTTLWLWPLISIFPICNSWHWPPLHHGEFSRASLTEIHWSGRHRTDRRFAVSNAISYIIWSVAWFWCNSWASCDKGVQCAVLWLLNKTKSCSTFLKIFHARHNKQNIWHCCCGIFAGLISFPCSPTNIVWQVLGRFLL